MAQNTDKILVIGGSGGIGEALVRALLDRHPEADITATYFQTQANLEHGRLRWVQLDVRDNAAIERLAAEFDRLDWLINCVGALHIGDAGPEKTITAVDGEFVKAILEINTLPTLMLARYFFVAMKKSPQPLFATISAKVGSIEDNKLGGWYSYRLSKAALNMALKTLSIEWTRTHPNGCVVALHPGTNNTKLSKPFQANVPTQNLLEPSYTANMFLDILENLNSSNSGQFLAWDGEELPW